eukprot:6930528-Prymnesium_polylepis.6
MPNHRVLEPHKPLPGGVSVDWRCLINLAVAVCTQLLCMTCCAGWRKHQAVLSSGSCGHLRCDYYALRLAAPAALPGGRHYRRLR